MKIIALIPARSGSKRIPNKNIKLLGGKPLMAWSIECARALRLETWVTTDSDEYADLANELGAYALMRPAALASDSAGDFDVIRHALQEVPGDLVVYLRPTTPFREAKRVWVAIKIMGHYDYTGLRSVEEMPESAFKCFGLKGGFLQPLSKVDITDWPNQRCPKTYKPNGYVDIVRREVIESGELWGAKRWGYVTPPAVELDTLREWEFAEYLIERRTN